MKTSGYTLNDALTLQDEHVAYFIPQIIEKIVVLVDLNE